MPKYSHQGGEHKFVGNWKFHPGLPDISCYLNMQNYNIIGGPNFKAFQKNY